MKNKIYSFALTGIVAASSLLTSTVFAADGNINITGEITGTTCTVKGSGANGDVAVTLDTASTHALAAQGETAGFKPFNITLSSCSAASTVKAGFEVGPNTDLVSGRLNLTGAGTAGVAGNVQLQLRNSDSSPIKIGDNSTVISAPLDAGGAAVLSYQVGYYATNAATPGTANSAVTYSIVYQ